jgi:hypothetical protein
MSIFRALSKFRPGFYPESFPRPNDNGVVPHPGGKQPWMSLSWGPSCSKSRYVTPVTVPSAENGPSNLPLESAHKHSAWAIHTSTRFLTPLHTQGLFEYDFTIECWLFAFTCVDFEGQTFGVWGFDSQRGWEFFSSPPRTDRLWGTFTFLSDGYGGIFPRVKRPGRETDRSPPSAKVKNAWSYTSTANTSSWHGA